MRKKKKLTTGWKKRQDVKTKKIHKTQKLAKFLTKASTKIPIGEKIIKVIIFIALKIAVRPSYWKRSKEQGKQIVQQTFNKISSKEFIFHPTSLAFYLLLAFMPIIFLSIIIIGLISKYMHNGHEILSYFSDQLEKIFNTNFGVNNMGDILSNGWSITGTVTTILISFWISSAGFGRFIYTQSHIFNHEHLGGFWANRIKGMLVVLFTSGYVAMGIICLSLFPVFMDLFQLKNDSIGYKSLYYVLMSISSFGYIYVAFVLLYVFSPRFKIKWRQIHPGAIVTTIATLIFGFTFISITQIIGSSKNSPFSTFGAYMSLATLLLFISYFIYVGVITNAAFYKTFWQKNTVKKWSIHKK